MKAEYIGKYYGTGYDRDSVYLEYRYRGHRYEVHENRAEGNEPLAWQHRSEQDRIDRLIDTEERTGSGTPFDIDEIFEILGWD
jgi:hypothetical protein